jgi:hypothetical protein
LPATRKAPWPPTGPTPTTGAWTCWW